MKNSNELIIIGAGPAGLAAGYEAAGHGLSPHILEKSGAVGGIARTEDHHGYRYDIGGHRFYTKVEAVQKLWEEMLGNDFLTVPRLSRIYYGGYYFQYPLDFVDTLRGLGLAEAFRILWSYFLARLNPHPVVETFEQWVENHFGRRLYETFFKVYTEKVWGMPCSEIQASWAAQRIKGLSFGAAVANAIFGRNNAKSMIDAFYYPKHGPGMMWARFAQSIEKLGGKVSLNNEVLGLVCREGRIEHLRVKDDDKEYRLSTEQVISSMPLSILLERMSPPPPPEVLSASRALRYRDFLIVGLVVDRPELFPDNWLYIHSPEVRVGRIQNFKNWSLRMVPDPDKTSLGMEYFCSQGDEIWERTDAELIDFATQELSFLGLAEPQTVESGVVIRQRRAYPVYDRDYQTNLKVIRAYLSNIENLQTIDRNGLHRYNNQDHSMLTGMLAVRNFLGERHNIWEINTERSYYEDFEMGLNTKEKASAN